MVRPKASSRNLSIAEAFGKLFVITADSTDHNTVQNIPVPCLGPKSLYSLFAACLPHLSREARAQQPKNRSGVTMVEFNKALNSAGLRQADVNCRDSFLKPYHFFLDRSTRRQDTCDGSQIFRIRQRVRNNLVYDYIFVAITLCKYVNIPNKEFTAIGLKYYLRKFFLSALVSFWNSLSTSALTLQTGVGRLPVAESGGCCSSGHIVGEPARGSSFR